MKLTEEKILDFCNLIHEINDESSTRSMVESRVEQFNKIKQQILDDYEKARTFDSLELEKDVLQKVKENEQNQKLRELIEKEVDADCDCEYGGCRHSMAEQVLKESKK